MSKTKTKIKVMDNRTEEINFYKLGIGLGDHIHVIKMVLREYWYGLKNA